MIGSAWYSSLNGGFCSRVVFFACALGAWAGCGTDVSPPPSEPLAAAPQITVDQEIGILYNKLETLPTARDAEIIQGVLYHLNQWLKNHESQLQAIKNDPLVEKLPTLYRNLLTDNKILERANFGLPKEPDDTLSFQQAIWIKAIAERIKSEKPDPALRDWLRGQEKTLGVADAQRLGQAERLFDWTIRNIQLDPLPPQPAAPIAGTGDARDLRSLPGPLRGEIGPGYWLRPYEVLQYGHGDAWQRARIFLLLCRQLEIPAVMLATEDEKSGENKPWLPAVLLHNQLFLLDTRLGLPIPGPGDQGVATLEQVVADPLLLRRLDLEGGPAYPITEADLKHLVALVEAEPSSLSQRMRLLDGVLIGNQRLGLAAAPSQLEAAVRGCKHLGNVSIWLVGIEAELFQQSSARLQRPLPAPYSAWAGLPVLFGFDSIVLHARHQQLLGKFDNESAKKLGARQIFLALRPTDHQIEMVEYNSQARDYLGVPAAELPPDPKQQKQYLAMRMEMFRIRKQLATYWLGLTYQETGNPAVAEEWLKERVLEAPADSPWKNGARYNLARVYESLGDLPPAIALYTADDSPQKAGNHLRAKLLEKRMSAVKPTPPAAAPDK